MTSLPSEHFGRPRRRRCATVPTALKIDARTDRERLTARSALGARWDRETKALGAPAAKNLRATIARDTPTPTTAGRPHSALLLCSRCIGHSNPAGSINVASDECVAQVVFMERQDSSLRGSQPAQIATSDRQLERRPRRRTQPCPRCNSDWLNFAAPRPMHPAKPPICKGADCRAMTNPIPDLRKG